MTARRLKFTHILNCRDLGGFETPYGVTKFGRFLRAGVVEIPDETEIKKLEDYGVKTVIDLRGDFEVNDMQTGLDRISGCKHLNISLYEANVANANGEMGQLGEIYSMIVDENRNRIRTVLEAIADADDGCIFCHCFFGKDRTGILTLLLLTIAGVDEDDIIADYEVTYSYIRRYVDEHADTLWSKDGTFHYSKADTLITLIENIKKEYGSVYGYILNTGISEEKITKIRNKFFK